MTARTVTAVIVKVNTTDVNGDRQTTYYGPFLSHASASLEWFMSELPIELGDSGRYQGWSMSVEDVLIGDTESDCIVQPRP